MSFQDKVERKKSTRWTQAFTPNYSGDDWSDDDEYYPQNAGAAAPKLPDISDIQQHSEDKPSTSASVEATPNLNLEQKFQQIDLDQEDDEEEEVDSPVVNDEYTALINENDVEKDEDDEYKPQASSHFQPLPVTTENENEVKEKAIPSHTHDVNQKPQVSRDLPSKFDPFPKDANDEDYDKEVVLSDVESLKSENHTPVDQPFNEQSQSSIRDDHDNSNSMTDEVHEQLLSGSDSFNNDYASSISTKSKEIESSERTHDDFTLNDYDDSDIEDFVPQKSHYFQSTLPDETPVEERHVMNDESEIPRIIEPSSGDQEVSTSIAEETYPLTPSQTQQQLDIPHYSPAELSDTDTLHIHDPDDEEREDDHHDDYVPVEYGQLRTSESTQSVVNADDFKELSYLSSIINTPDANRGSFQSDNSGSTPVLNRDSKFYHGVDDYYNEYIEPEHEQIPETNDEQNDEDILDADGADNDDESLKETEKHLSKISTQSSGSLSTGGVSIRSETNRSSRFSERTTSFTNQSISQIPYDDLNRTTDSIHAEDDSSRPSLNPALSINFGHWRPNTESFRDQFISGSSPGLPPMPKLDNYTRNSRGEIVEETNSIAESALDSITNVSDLESLKIKNSFGDSHNVDSSDGITRKLSGTYKTESDSQLPLHIPLGTPDSSTPTEKKTHYFQEDNKSLDNPGSSGITTANLKKTIPRKVTTFDFKQIATLDNPSMRIERYRKAREEELNTETGLDQWIQHALNKVDIVNYSTASSAHVKQAYAEASSNPRKHHHSNINVKKKLQDTSSTAQSLAKGLFSRGRKIIKN